MHIQVKQSCNVLSKPVILLSNTCRIIVPAGGQRVGGCTPLECGGWHDGTFAIDIACVSNVFFYEKNNIPRYLPAAWSSKMCFALGKWDMQWTKWRRKWLATCNGHGQSGWSPIGCEVHSLLSLANFVGYWAEVWSLQQVLQWFLRGIQDCFRG